MKPIHDLAWGCPIVVRQALLETLNSDERSFANDWSFAKIHLNRMGYPPHLGTPKLIEYLKDMAQRQSGYRPKHLMVTCGATGAINAAIYALKTSETKWVTTNKRFYPMYPSIIEVSGLNQAYKHASNTKASISLVDSPSAPEGMVYPFKAVDIWDGAYASKVYTSGGQVPIDWKIMCGSLSKTSGMAGLRLGWVSTDEDVLADRLAVYVSASYIGLSVLSMNIAEHILEDLDQTLFETRASGYLDNNREEMQKLLTKFGQGSAPSRGMFVIVELGKAERKALEKANVKWQPGSTWGEDDNWARLSLGQTREVIRSAIKAVLK